MSEVIEYAEFIKRNRGYIDSDLQRKIRQTKLLIAGCGVGSTTAEAAIRLGFENITLIDADSVSVHNLNRQCFVASDIGRAKVCALSQRLKAINPNSKITELNAWVATENAHQLVENADFVIDTIDFLDLSAIIALHDECHLQHIPVVSGFSAGMGSVAIFFEPGNPCTFRSLFDIPASGSVNNMSYVEKFSKVMDTLKNVFDSNVHQAISKSLEIMEDGKPCPAPHLSIGAFSLAALTMTIVVGYLSGRRITAAPQMIIDNLIDLIQKPGILLQSNS
jgi:molybdopterin/thiamine biosynthesis adenylyltransferase